MAATDTMGLEHDPQLIQGGALPTTLTELRKAVLHAHAVLAPDETPPDACDLAVSLRVLANERAGWINAALFHNSNCPQLNGRGPGRERTKVDIECIRECLLSREFLEAFDGDSDLAGRHLAAHDALDRIAGA